MKTFGQRLRHLREEKDMSQIDMGKELNIANSTLSLYESGGREPDFVTLKKIAEYFNVTTDYLLARTDDKQKLSADNYLNYLTAEEKEFVLKEKMWIKLAAECAGQGLSPDKVKELIHIAMQFR